MDRLRIKSNKMKEQGHRQKIKTVIHKWHQ